MSLDSCGWANDILRWAQTDKIELEKQSYCDLKVTNSTEHCVAFKVKTTSPKKYFVRPNTGIIHPWDSCFIRVTLQAQKEYPPDMQCKDKFLLQSTVVNNDSDELSPDTFNKDSGRTVEECKLRVVYISPHSSPGHSEDAFKQSSDVNSSQALQRARDERDAAFRQTQQLQQEVEVLKRRRTRRGDAGFSLKFALVVGVIGIMVGFLFKLLMSSPSTE
ncbi:vesicle-associated protein 2-1 [Nicotiana tabacum]|uniref:Vesicle-associated protein 2-1 n=1 Tax=Nicotiana tabacum TaxID=4097 RepID=A0AC58TXP2_TOBAC